MVNSGTAMRVFPFPVVPPRGESGRKPGTGWIGRYVEGFPSCGRAFPRV